jgi:hypothetical protein
LINSKRRHAMSDTPETDAKASPHIRFYSCATVPANFARDLERERDEARAAIPSGEWVAYADHQKVHNAASRLLVAINKQLPIGSFSLISHEYHALKDAIYGREGAR